MNSIYNDPKVLENINGTRIIIVYASLSKIHKVKMIKKNLR